MVNTHFPQHDNPAVMGKLSVTKYSVVISVSVLDFTAPFSEIVIVAIFVIVDAGG